MKKRWCIVLLVFVLVVVLAGFLFFDGDQEVLDYNGTPSSETSYVVNLNEEDNGSLSEATNDSLDELNYTLLGEEYYVILRERCMNLSDSTYFAPTPRGCCLDSVETMEEYGYFGMDKNNECPDGFEGVVASCLEGGAVPYCVPEGDRRFMNPGSYTNMDNASLEY